MKPGQTVFAAVRRLRFRDWVGLLVFVFGVFAADVVLAADDMAAAGVNRLPNIVLVIADDLGWSDLGCYGADLHETPALDQMAADGLRFTTARAPAPVCTPTRAAIMTGKHPARLKMTIWHEGALDPPQDRALIPGRSLANLPLSEVTLAERLSTAGYLTATIGKWHLGDAGHAPETQGFDINIGGTHWGAPESFFFPYRGARRFGGEFRYVPHLEFGSEGEYLTDRLTDEALRVIEYAQREQRPFFLTLAHHAPHTPIQAKQSDIDEFQRRRHPEHHHQHPVYAAMIRSLDQSIGRVIQSLDEHEFTKDTLLIFTSDNGGYLGTTQVAGSDIPITSNWPLRSGKGTLYEGGLRVPLLIRWPGRIARGQVCDVPVVLTDLFPTIMDVFAEATNSSRVGEQAAVCDGVSLLPLLTAGHVSNESREFFFHYPHYYHAPPSTPASAIVSGHWKLIEYFEDSRLELFDLQNDRGEEHECGKDHPEIVTALKESLHAWQMQVDAELPVRRDE